MNDDGRRVAGWSWRKIAEVGAIVLLGQLILVFALSRRPVSLESTPARSTPAGLYWRPEGATPTSEITDPATFALVGRRGFSGPLWLARSTTSGPPVQDDGGVDPIQMEPAAPLLQPRFQGSAAADFPPPTVGAGLLPAARTLPAAPAVLQPRSVMRLSGSLAGGTVALPATLPAWTNLDVVAPTTVQILVGAEGDVLSASLLPPGSGLAAADQFALQAARQLRFGPAQSGKSSPGLTWATVDFLWQTAAPEMARAETGPRP